MAIAAKGPASAPTSFTPAVVLTAVLGVLTLASISGNFIPAAAAVTVLGTVLALSRPTFVAWPNLIGVLILIILFVPIRRYTLPGSLPFQLEPYRVFVALLVGGWLASLLVDRRTRFRRTGFEGPLLLIVGSAIASVVTNPDRVAQFPAEVNKSLMFLLSYVLILYVISSVIRRVENIDLLAKTLVAGGGVVAVLAIVEGRTEFNAFNHLSTVMPFLQDQGADVGGYQRLGTANLRVFGSAQHPIALSAALVMLLPLAMYLARRHGQRRWIACGLALGIACAATISRTGILMFVVAVLVFLWLRPKEVRRLWPLIFPALIAIHFVLPGTLGAIKQSFLPAGGLVAEQHASANSSGSGRLADLGPALTLWQEQPLLGQGYGTQVVNLNAGGIETNIFDDQWLGTLLATRRDRLRRLALVLRPSSPEIRSRSETRRLRARLAAGVSGGGNRRLRRRDAHVRRFRLYPGDLLALHLRGHRRSTPCRASCNAVARRDRDGPAASRSGCVSRLHSSQPALGWSQPPGKADR